MATSRPCLLVNDDGSVDVFFGPRAVEGLEANCIETGDSRTFELMFRFYGVGAEVLTKPWQLDDAELVDASQMPPSPA